MSVMQMKENVVSNQDLKESDAPFVHVQSDHSLSINHNIVTVGVSIQNQLWRETTGLFGYKIQICHLCWDCLAKTLLWLPWWSVMAIPIGQTSSSGRYHSKFICLNLILEPNHIYWIFLKLKCFFFATIIVPPRIRRRDKLMRVLRIRSTVKIESRFWLIIKLIMQNF